MNIKVLFFGRHNCIYSQKIYKFLNKNFYDVTFIKSKKLGEKLNEDKDIFKKKFDYIFCFRSFYILDKILSRVNLFAINFHPCTPKYSGVGGVNYALYQDKYFGCTAHLMNRKVDNGKIIDVKYFKLRKYETLEKVLAKTYTLQTKQIIKIIKAIIADRYYINKQLKKNNKIKWTKNFYTMKMLNKFYEINCKITKKNLLKKINSTVIRKYKPYILLHGEKFILQLKKDK
tara:strand:- start:113 stop:802 length:690 start_codon:yes stop_codon:yes gene_type:complete